MNEWGYRELRANKLVRLCTEYLLKDTITAKQVYGLCRLTWITNSNDSANGRYIKSTKLPALSNIFEVDFLDYPYDEIGKKIAELTGNSVKVVHDLIYEGTGYTNFYNAYRVSAKNWISENIDEIIPLIHIGFNIRNDNEAESIASAISLLPGIPKGNKAPGKMHPENLLSPLFFSLDKRRRFPLINGNEGVTKILKQLRVHNQDFVIKFKAIVGLLGKGDIKTAIDVDCLGGELPYFVSIDDEVPERKRLTKKTDKELELKDEDDVIVIKKALSTKAKRLHNKLTNILLDRLSQFELHEGNSNENKFDVLVKNITSNKEDILIEVKSASDISNVRMAVGQLMDYSRQLDNHNQTYEAVLMPEKPDKHVIDFLDFYDFGIIWIEENEIYANNKAFPFKYKKI